MFCFSRIEDKLLLRHNLDIIKCLYTSQQFRVPVFQHRLIPSIIKLIYSVLICVLTYLEISGLELASSTWITNNMKLCNYLSLQDWDVRSKQAPVILLLVAIIHLWPLWGYQKSLSFLLKNITRNEEQSPCSLKAFLGGLQDLKQAPEILSFVHGTTF